MKNFFYDTEFLEGKQRFRLFGIIPLWKKRTPTIDLISVGIVREDYHVSRKGLHLLSKNFNLREAWYRFDWNTEEVSGDLRNIYPEGRQYKEYWIRENVLRPIFNHYTVEEVPFTYRNFKKVLRLYGLTDKQLKSQLLRFTIDHDGSLVSGWEDMLSRDEINSKLQAVAYLNINLYGWYSAYDHVAISWLFGKMLSLPKGFPMYTRDLKQTYDEMQEARVDGVVIKELPKYPKNSGEHNALHDAIFNLDLYNFLKTI